MGIQEILAAKKAKALADAAAKEAPASNEVPSAVVPMQAPAAAVAVVVASQEAIKTNPAADPMLDENGKPLSGFARIKRMKELAAQSNSVDTPAPITVSKAMTDETTQAQAPVSSISASPVIVGMENASGSNIKDAVQQEVQAPTTIDAGAEQAYADMKQQLDALVSMSADDLKPAMQNLKRSLMQNPNAVALMLPSDIGQMVIALRKMTGVELAKAADGKKTATKAKKEKTMTAEELEDAFKEL